MGPTASQGINHFLFMCAVGFLGVMTLQTALKWWREQVKIRRALAEFQEVTRQVRQHLIAAGRPVDAFDEAVKNFVKTSRNPASIRAAQDIVSIVYHGCQESSHQTASPRPERKAEVPREVMQ